MNLKTVALMIIIIIITIFITLYFCKKQHGDNHGGNKTDTVYIGNNFPMCNKDSIPKDPDQAAGIVVTQAEYMPLVQAYASSNPSNWGGRLGQWQMMALLRSLTPEQKYISYRFYKIPGGNKIGVIFSGGTNFTGHGGPAHDTLRYTSGSEGWCPINCY